MEVHILGVGNKIKYKDKDFMLVLIKIFSKATLWMVKSMDLGFKYYKMEINFKVIGRMILNKDKVEYHLKTVLIKL